MAGPLAGLIPPRNGKCSWPLRVTEQCRNFIFLSLRLQAGCPQWEGCEARVAALPPMRGFQLSPQITQRGFCSLWGWEHVMEGGDVRPSLTNTVMRWAGKEFDTHMFSFLALETHLSPSGSSQPGSAACSTCCFSLPSVSRPTGKPPAPWWSSCLASEKTSPQLS